MFAPIYLDYAATTPLDPAVWTAMLPFWQAEFGNAASSHVFGRVAADAVQTARLQLAKAIGADAPEIIFTSGATEANNLAILGMARFYAKTGGHIVAMRTEHKAIIDPIRHLESQGWHVSWVKTPAQIPEVCRENTKLITLMWVNNELGSVNPIAEIAEFARTKGIYFHVDAAQALGKIAIDLAQIPVDSMAFSGHKIYAPKGIGALFVRRQPRPPLQAVQFGGGQERGLRSGTLAVPLIVGFGAAAQRVSEVFQTEPAHITHLYALFWQKLEKLNVDKTPIFQRNLFETTASIPHICNIQCSKVHGESLHALLDALGLAVSAGSACNSARGEASYVLRALGLSDAEATASVRVAFGRMTSLDDAEKAADRLIWAVRILQPQTPEAPNIFLEFAKNLPNLAHYSPEISTHFWQYLLRNRVKMATTPNSPNQQGHHLVHRALHANIHWLCEITPAGLLNFDFEAEACPSLIASLQYLKNHLQHKKCTKATLDSLETEMSRENIVKNLRLAIEKSACALVIGQIVRAIQEDLSAR